MSLLKRIGETASLEDGMINVPLVMEHYDLDEAQEGNLLFFEKSGAEFSMFDHPLFESDTHPYTNLACVFLGEKIFPFKQKRKIAREQVILLPKSIVLKRDGETTYQWLEELTGHWVTGFEFYAGTRHLLEWFEKHSSSGQVWLEEGAIRKLWFQKQEEKSCE